MFIPLTEYEFQTLGYGFTPNKAKIIMEKAVAGFKDYVPAGIIHNHVFITDGESIFRVSIQSDGMHLILAKRLTLDSFRKE